MSTHYFKATDGETTVFRASKTRFYRSANIRGRYGIGFSAATTGDHPAIEITKAEYEALVAAKIERVKASGGKIEWATSPQDSWVRNASLMGG